MTGMSPGSQRLGSRCNSPITLNIITGKKPSGGGRTMQRNTRSGRTRAGILGRVLARCIFLLCAASTAACAQRGLPDAIRRDQFGIDTESGLVLAVVSGDAIGLTDAGLTHLVEKGVARTYLVRCFKESDQVKASRVIVWHVTKVGIRQNAMISVNVMRNGIVEVSTFAHVPAPGSFDGLFMLEVGRLAKKVLPRPTIAAVPSFVQCS